MIGFLFAAGILLVLALGLLLWPLLRNAEPGEEKKASAVVALFRDQLRELEAEHAAGTLGDAQFQQSRIELERRLLEEVGPDAAAPAGPKRARGTALALGVLVLAIPVVLYSRLGTPDALAPGATMAVAGAQNGGPGGAPNPSVTAAQIQKMIDKLQASLQKNPGDAAGWAMLGRVYAYIGEQSNGGDAAKSFQNAVHAYAKAVALTPKDPNLLVDFADALAMTQGQDLDGMPMKLISRALKIDPRNVKGLALAGTDAFGHRRYADAIVYWERAVQAAPEDPQFAQNLRSSIQEARNRAKQAGQRLPADLAANAASGMSAAAAAAAGVQGKVEIASDLAAKAAPDETVFIYARAAFGPRVPLAMLRRQVKDLPMTFALNDAMAMVPAFTMSKFSPVVIEARVSRSGDAMPASGDLEGSSQPVAVGTKGLTITIDHVVP